MDVKDVRLRLVVFSGVKKVTLYDQEGHRACSVFWGWYYTKPQAIAIAKRLRDRFNDGQEGK